MEEKGIIETLKAAVSVEEVQALTEKIQQFNWASDKTLRKFQKIARRKRSQFIKSKG